MLRRLSSYRFTAAHHTTLRRGRRALALLLGCTISIAAACSSSGTSDTDQSAGAAQASDASSADGADPDALPDPCGLVGPEEVTDLLGVEPASRPATTDDPAVFAGCTWGELTSGNVLSVQLGRSIGEVNRIRALAQVSKDTASSSVGTDGLLLKDVALIPGGGGVGATVVFEHGDVTASVSATSPDVSQESLETLARSVDASLG